LHTLTVSTTRPNSRTVYARRLATRGSLYFNNSTVILSYNANISVSSDDALREQVKAMGVWLKDELEHYDVETKLVDLSKIVSIPNLPNLVLGRIDGPTGNNLKTVLVYGHYDVQPVSVAFLTSLVIFFSISELCIRRSQTMLGRRKATTLSS
jgi:hypothetical protein